MLRARTTAAAVLVVALTLVLASWVLLVTLENSLSRNQDAAARGRAGDLARAAASGLGAGDLAALGEDTLAQVVTDSGEVLATSPTLRGRPPITRFRPPDDGVAVRVVGVRDQDEVEPYRVWGRRTTTPDGPVTVYVGTSTELVSEAVATLRGLLLLGVPLVVAVLAGVAWSMLGRALRPVEAVRREVSVISESDLSRRVPVPAGTDEIARLARTMNEMLARLEAASHRQRTFVADASHELQSPLATVRAELEVALARPGSVAWPDVARGLLRDTDVMERLVRDLLFLAREEEGSASPAAHGPVDLDDVVLEEVARLRSVASVDVDATAVSAAPVRGSRDQLVRAVRNLLENAERHARSTVEVRLEAAGGVVELLVGDDGPGVPATDRKRVFERFVRLDDGRSRARGGTGLGLSIVAAVARAHGGSVEVRDRVGAEGGTWGAVFAMSLPEHREAAPGAPRTDPRAEPSAAGRHTRQ